MTSIAGGGPRRRPGRPEENEETDRKKPGLVLRIRRLGMPAALCYVALFAWTGHHVGRAERAYAAGRLDEAHELLLRAAFWRVRAGRVQDALGVVDLARGRLDEAGDHLARARRGLFHPSAFGEQTVLASFLRAGRYEPARVYAEHRLALGPDPAAAFYLGAAQNALGRIDEADRSLSIAAADASLGPRIAEQRDLLAGKRASGRSDYLLDRAGAPIAGVDLKSGRPTLLVPGLRPWLEGPDAVHLDPIDLSNRVRLTLDLEMQRAGEAALGAHRGSVVVIDVATGGLLAAVAQPASAAGGPQALSRTYEPGSIVKMITMTAALRKGLDVERMFPLDCPGWTALDGVAFRDWIPHGRVASIDQAVAVSCNIAFAKIGQIVGRDAIDAELRRFGFQFDSDTMPGATDFPYRTGTLLPADAIHPGYALARRAVGLDSLRITPLGAALLAAALARGSAPPIPYLIDEKLNILGESYYRHAPTRLTDPLPPDQTAVIVRTMKSAVTGVGRAVGTARRAGVEGVTAAMKTGTSGRRREGYDGLVIGFAPADRPAIAWAVIADHSGKAEFEAAKITAELLRRIRPKIP